MSGGSRDQALLETGNDSNRRIYGNRPVLEHVPAWPASMH